MPTELEILQEMVKQNLTVAQQQAQQIQGLTAAVSGLVAERSAPPPEREPTDEEYRERPSLMLEKFQKALNQVAAPINEFKQQHARAQMYEQSKKAVRSKDARYDKLWNKIEPALDYAMSQANIDPTEAIVAYHVKALVGDYLMANPTALTELNSSSMHIPPSPPAPPKATEAPPARELTDNEKVIAKSRGWTAEEYLKRQAEPGNSIVVTRGAKK